MCSVSLMNRNSVGRLKFVKTCDRQVSYLVKVINRYFFLYTVIPKVLSALVNNYLIKSSYKMYLF